MFLHGLGGSGFGSAARPGWEEGEVAVADMIVAPLGILSWWWQSSLEICEVMQKGTGHKTRAHLSDRKAEKAETELVNV